MNSASSLKAIQEKTEIPKEQFKQVLGDPKKTLYCMFGIAVLAAVFLIGVLAIENSFTAQVEVKKLQNQPVKVEEEPKQNFDTERKADVELINSAVAGYFAKNQSYPQTLSSLIPQYLATVPRDPETQKEYSYRVSLDFKSYEVWAKLDNGEEYLLTN